MNGYGMENHNVSDGIITIKNVVLWCIMYNFKRLA